MKNDIAEYLPLVKWVAFKIASRLPRHVDAGDLISVGLHGLFKAMENFDEERGSKFETYAVALIRGAILDELRALDWVPRSIRDKASTVNRVQARLLTQLGREPTHDEMARELEISDEAYHKLLVEVRPATLLPLQEAPQLPDHDEAVEQNETHALLGAAIKALPKQEKKVVQLYYYKGLNLREVGVKMGLGESRISQIHASALTHMRSYFDEHA